MDYNTSQTGGTGFIIEFPEESGITPIKESFRRDGQGIHRLEMIAVLEGLSNLLQWIAKNGHNSVKGSRVIVKTDRYSITDKEILNPWKIAGWRKNGWKNYEGKPIKDKDLIDAIDKARKKLSRIIGARIQIDYIRRKYNKEADKLSKQGKEGQTKNRAIYREKNTKVAKRLYDGSEISYRNIDAGDELEIRVYRKDPVQKEFEISAEISDGDHFGKKIKIYVDFLQELELHRHHFYKIEIESVYKHHIRIRSEFREIESDPE